MTCTWIPLSSTGKTPPLLRFRSARACVVYTDTDFILPVFCASFLLLRVFPCLGSLPARDNPAPDIRAHSGHKYRHTVAPRNSQQFVSPFLPFRLLLFPRIEIEINKKKYCMCNIKRKQKSRPNGTPLPVPGSSDPVIGCPVAVVFLFRLSPGKLLGASDCCFVMCIIRWHMFFSFLHLVFFVFCLSCVVSQLTQLDANATPLWLVHRVL